MLPRRMHRRICGHLIALDLYTPRLTVGHQGVILHADSLIIVRRNHMDWKWVVGLRLMGFGVALSAPK